MAPSTKVVPSAVGRFETVLLILVFEFVEIAFVEASHSAGRSLFGAMTPLVKTARILESRGRGFAVELTIEVEGDADCCASSFVDVGCFSTTVIGANNIWDDERSMPLSLTSSI